MAGLYSDDFIESLRAGAQSLTSGWGLSPQTEVSLLTVSENATFRADDPERAAPLILRVHRPDYHSRAEIMSELAWIDALRAEEIVPIPAPVPQTGGDLIAGVDAAGAMRDVVAFEFMSGHEPAPSDDLEDGFRDLGAISARLHGHARRWARPGGFARKTWNFDTTVGATPHWGDWREALGLTPDGKAVLEQACDKLEARLGAFGMGEDRFGLIHADLRLANLLIDEGRIGVIDFDDCGFGWFAFDFAAAISFFETDPVIPSLQDAWVEGYRSVADLPAEVEAEIPTFIMLRRLQLTAWIASHQETPTAQEMGAAFTDGTIDIANKFLATGSRS
ncbi:phosphotransferase [Rhodobacteraceae bacterium NNCM2]|nr:phosphotransferase [Coraliihabitans acroporae]